MNWIKKYRIAKLQEDLHAIRAVMFAEEEVTRRTGNVYPSSVVINAEKKARLEFRLARLTK